METWKLLKDQVMLGLSLGLGLQRAAGLRSWRGVWECDCGYISFFLFFKELFIYSMCTCVLPVYTLYEDIGFPWDGHYRQL